MTAVEAAEAADMDYQSLMVMLGRVIDKGLIFKAKRGTYLFALPLFRDYILRHNP